MFNPEIKVIGFNVADVITTSVCGSDCPADNGTGGACPFDF